MQLTSNHMGQDLESREDMPTRSCPNIFTRRCTSRWWWGVAFSWSKMTPFSSSSIVCSEELASPYPAAVSSNISHWPRYQLAQDGRAQVPFSWRTWRAWLPEHPDCSLQFSSSVTFGHAIQHSLMSTKGLINASVTRQLLKSDHGMHCLHFFDAADGWWWEKLAWPCGHLWARF